MARERPRRYAGAMSDLELLQGAWRIIALEMNGGPMPAALLDAARIGVVGARFTSTGMGAVYEGEMSLDETSMPKTFALRFQAGPEAGAANRGIYELDGDRWRICLNMAGGPAPAEFATRPGDNCALETLVRET